MVERFEKRKRFWIFLGVLIILFILFFARFFYYNMIVPWPYRHELMVCLDEASIHTTENEIKIARNVCFRTYPHFN